MAVNRVTRPFERRGGGYPWQQIRPRFEESLGATTAETAKSGSTLAATLKTPAGMVLILMAAYSVLRNLAAAAAAPLWYDEILTWVVSSQPSWARILKALAEGVDGQPFFFYAIEHAFLRVVANREVALRLPAILAFPVTLGCVFVYAKRRGGDAAALTSATFLFATVLFHNYAADARPYSMVVACFAFALVSYQRICNPNWAVGLAIALLAAEALHYYSLFSVLPFGVAESVYLLRERKFRWQVWAALACPLLPLGLAWPIIANFKKMYAAHFWSHYSWRDLPRTYGAVLTENAAKGVWAFGLGIAIVSAGMLIAYHFRGPTSTRDRRSSEGWSETALLLAVLVLPFTTFLATRILHGGMLDRYVLTTCLALALGVGRIPLFSKALLVLIAAAFLLLIAGRELIFWQTVDFTAAERFALADESFSKSAGYSDLPVMVDDALLFLPLELYGSYKERSRFVYLVDGEKAIMYSGSDSIDKNLVQLRPYLPFQMPDYVAYSRVHTQFLLLIREPKLRSDWLSSYLPSVASLELIEEIDNRRLYLVKIRETSRNVCYP